MACDAAVRVFHRKDVFGMCAKRGDLSALVSLTKPDTKPYN
jgi:hypothetical protein